MYEYKVPVTLSSYIRRILVRGYHEFRSYPDEKTNTYVFLVHESPKTFEKIYDRASCEKLSKETGEFFITQTEAKDEGFKTYIRDFTGVNGFSILTEFGKNSPTSTK